MKKILSITGLMLTALSLIQCTDDNIDKMGMELTSQPQLHVEYTPITDGSRTTTNPDGTVEWDAQDQLNVFVVEHGKQPQQITDWQKYSYKYITDSKNCKEGIFTPYPGMKQPTFYQGYSYDWYVLSPYNLNVKDPIGGTDSQTSFEIGDQTQEYDQPMKHIVKSDILTAITTNVMAGENPGLHLHHKGTLMKFTIQNCENKPVTLRNIKFKAPSDVCIAGKFSIDFKETGYLTPMEKKDSILLTIKNAKPLDIGKSYDTYVVMQPFTLKKGDVFNIDVTSDLGIMRQTTTILDNKQFLAGRINTAVIKVESSNLNDGRIIIPDKNFENYLLSNFDINSDGRIYSQEIENVTEINIKNKNIKSLEGIEYMKQLRILNCESNLLHQLDLNKNKNIEILNCSHNTLQTLNIDSCVKLKSLICNKNELTFLNLKNCTHLITLECNENKLKTLNNENCVHIETLLCNHNELIAINTKNLSLNLRKLECQNNNLQELNITKNYNLSLLDTRNNIQLNKIYVWDGFNERYRYFIKDNFTQYIWIKDNSKEVNIPDPNFKSYLIEKHDENKDGIFSENERDFTQSIDCSKREIKTLSGIEHFVNLQSLNCNYNKLQTLDISQNLHLKELKCLGSSKFRIIYVPDNFNEKNYKNIEKNGETIYVPKNTKLDFGGTIVTIPEKPFKDYLIEHYDFNEDGNLSTGECNLITYIEINPTSYMHSPEPEPEIHTAEGIEYMPNLTHLDFHGYYTLMSGHEVEQCYGGLTTLDISNNNKLNYLDCRFNNNLKNIYVWKEFNPSNFKRCEIYRASITYK